MKMSTYFFKCQFFWYIIAVSTVCKMCVSLHSSHTHKFEWNWILLDHNLYSVVFLFEPVCWCRTSEISQLDNNNQKTVNTRKFQLKKMRGHKIGKITDDSKAVFAFELIVSSLLVLSHERLCELDETRLFRILENSPVGYSPVVTRLRLKAFLIVSTRRNGWK